MTKSWVGGGIGLDFHYNNSPRERQQEAFRQQLRLARAANRPVIIHTREADEETCRDPGRGVFGQRRSRRSTALFHFQPEQCRALSQAGLLHFIWWHHYVSESGRVEGSRQTASRRPPADRDRLSLSCPGAFSR